jgi:hypothetical protein
MGATCGGRQTSSAMRHPHLQVSTAVSLTPGVWLSRSAWRKHLMTFDGNALCLRGMTVTHYVPV